MPRPLLPPERRPLAALIALASLGLIATALLSLTAAHGAAAEDRDGFAQASRFQAELLSRR